MRREVKREKFYSLRLWPTLRLDTVWGREEDRAKFSIATWLWSRFFQVQKETLLFSPSLSPASTLYTLTREDIFHFWLLSPASGVFFSLLFCKPLHQKHTFTVHICFSFAHPCIPFWLAKLPEWLLSHHLLFLLHRVRRRWSILYPRSSIPSPPSTYLHATAEQSNSWAAEEEEEEGEEQVIQSLTSIVPHCASCESLVKAFACHQPEVLCS